MTTNLNDHLTRPFEKLESYYRVLNDRGRFTFYSSVVRTLKMLPFRVTLLINSIMSQESGKKTKQKISELLETGQILRVKHLETQGVVKSLEEFQNNNGVGSQKAEQIWKRGMRNIQDVKQYANEHPSFLSCEKQSGIKYYDDFMLKILRDEI